jgi:hypothetical protein
MDTNQWIEIAVRARHWPKISGRKSPPPPWEPIPGVPLTIDEVEQLVSKGELRPALRYYPDEIAIVVRSPANDRGDNVNETERENTHGKFSGRRERGRQRG